MGWNFLVQRLSHIKKHKNIYSLAFADAHQIIVLCSSSDRNNYAWRSGRKKKKTVLYSQTYKSDWIFVKSEDIEKFFFYSVYHKERKKRIISWVSDKYKLEMCVGIPCGITSCAADIEWKTEEYKLYFLSVYSPSRSVMWTQSLERWSTKQNSHIGYAFLLSEDLFPSFCLLVSLLFPCISQSLIWRWPNNRYCNLCKDTILQLFTNFIHVFQHFCSSRYKRWACMYVGTITNVR